MLVDNDDDNSDNADCSDEAVHGAAAVLLAVSWHHTIIMSRV